MTRKIIGRRVALACGIGACVGLDLVCGPVLAQQAADAPQVADAQPAAAPKAAVDQLEEVVVTAQKRASTVDKTPISITAVTGEDLQNRGITDFSAVAASTPGVSMKANGPGGQTEFEMRGMTSSGGNSPTVGFYLDDVPLTAPAAAQNGKVVIDPSLYDLSRIEVLRGPQGTLYGSGSMGGTIRLITNQPNLETFDASAQTILSGTDNGGFNHAENVMINSPLIKDQLAVRIVASQASTSGWIDRIVLGNFPPPTNGGLTRGDVSAAPVLQDNKQSNAERLEGGRIALTWKPISQLTVTPSVFFQRINQAGPSVFDSDPGTLAHYQPFGIAEPYSDSITVSNLTLNYKFDSFDVTSVTSKWHRLSSEVQDGSENFQNPLDGGESVSSPFYGPNGTGPIPGLEMDPSNQFTQELRAASTGDSALQWVVGAFHSEFASDWQLDVNFPNPATFGSPIATIWNLDQPTHIIQSALFGEGTYAITDKLKGTVGLRWYKYSNTTDMSFAGFFSPLGTNTPTLQHVVQSDQGLNPKFGVSYEANPDTLYYATAAKGFRPGGANQPLPAISCITSQLIDLGYTSGVAPKSYGPDTLWSYEVGDKVKLAGGRVRVAASAFFENWKDIQLEELPCNYPVFDNANSAHIYGGELEVKAALGGSFVLTAAGGYTHAQLAQTSHGFHEGDRLPSVPPVTATVGLNYHTPINEKYDLFARAENVYTGTRVDLTFPGGFPDTQSPLPSYDLTNLRVGVNADAGWSATLFANNVTNKKAYLENMVQLTLANSSFNRVATNQPLTVGVDLSYHF